MSTYAILTSGGDSPGMNCAIRAFTRTLIYSGHNVFGVKKGYQGLISGDFIQLSASSVGNILQRGGTFLQSSRSEEFKEKKFREIAYEKLKEHKIDGLAVVGGDGSFKGAYALWEDFNFPVVGIPGTIDNDISGTDYTIGHDTAVQTAVDAVDKIRDTAFSHDRVFLIEVMGRRSSSIAIKTALCSGAENVVLPNKDIDYEDLVQSIKRGEQRGKKGSIFIVAEGATEGRSYNIQKVLSSKYGISSRVCILGHIQRGGSPSPHDRLIATEMGFLAAETFLKFDEPKVIRLKNGKISTALLSQCLTNDDGIDIEHIEVIKKISI